MAKDIIDICVPDIGGGTDVDVIDIMVKVGDEIVKDQSLVTLEGDKATMDIPSPIGGIVQTIVMKVGDKVSQGALILTATPTGVSEIPAPVVELTPPKEPAPVVEPQVEPVVESTAPPVVDPVMETNAPTISAGPAARRLARELGVSLESLHGTGRKSRISKDDVVQFVKSKMSQPTAQGAFALPAMPVIDFSKFGEVEVKALNKIKRLTGSNLHRAWLTVPHVTQFDEADITALEAFRRKESENAQGYKLTLLAFVCKVVSKALQTYPQFNASLDASGENLIYKKYINIGIAVETPNGLVVPVLKEVDRLSVSDIAKDMASLSTKAREKGLMPSDMSGGCFTISSLGGIGGTAFTPIVNAPEVAILGLSRSSMKPVYDGTDFKPRLILPLSLSYDHRVIDGAEAARFTRFISEGLSDIRRILL